MKPQDRAAPRPEAEDGETAFVILRDTRHATEALRVWTPPDLASIACCISEFARERHIHTAEVEFRVQWPDDRPVMFHDHPPGSTQAAL